MPRSRVTNSNFDILKKHPKQAMIPFKCQMSSILRHENTPMQNPKAKPKLVQTGT